MRTLLICVVAAAFLLQYAESQKRKSSGGLECHVCTDPRSCLKKNSVICKEGEMCIRMQRPAYNPSDKPEPGEYGTTGGMIAGRGCTTQQGCEKSKKVKLYKTTCCSTNLCNA